MYFVFDIGGSNMRFSISSDGNTLSVPVKVSTPQDFKEGMKVFGDVFSDLTKKTKVVKAAGGVTGVFNRKRTVLLQSPHLKDWIGNPINEKISDIIGTPVCLENDTAMVGLGESSAGAGVGYDIVAYITISTGVGGVRIVKERIDISTFNYEPGHQIIDADGSMCPDCVASEDNQSLGHWEAHISGASLEKRFGKPASEITDESLWKEIEKYIAYGLNNTIVHWTPDVVVLGGGMMENPKINTERVKDHLKNILRIYPVHPDIKKAELGDFGGLHGSLAYLKNLEEKNTDAYE